MSGEFENFDMGAAVSAVSEGLGFGNEAPGDNDNLGGSDDLGNTTGGNSPTSNTTAADPSLADPAPESQLATEGAETGEPPPVEGVAATTAPKTWRKEALEKWATLDPAVQAEVLKREEDFFKGIEQYKADAEQGKAFQAVVNPYKQILDQYGIDPVQQLHGLMKSHYTLAFGTTAEKHQLIANLIREYGITPPQQGQSDEVTFQDPAVLALQEEVNALKSTETRRQAALRAQEVKRVQDEIAKFSSDPKNVYYAEVENDMAALIKGGVAKNLQEAYDKAIMLNPVTRAKELERQTAERLAKQREQEQKHAQEAAKLRAQQVKSTTKRGSGTAPLGSLDDTIKESLREIKSRN